MVGAGMNGMTMPRRFGGLNFPITPYTMCAEIVAAADAGFSNIWSLQDCIETLYEFGNEDQHSRFIPRICQGETMSMDLTEPDAGSDLQNPFGADGFTNKFQQGNYIPTGNGQAFGAHLTLQLP
jgi:alkylation response protein AidB-like acyl-CoA dehydrogenase